VGYEKTASGDPIYAQPERALGQKAFQRTDNGTEEMNVNGLAGGTPVVIWNGEATYWTPSGIGSATPGSAHSGSYGWDTGSTPKDDSTVFDGGSMIDVVGSYTSLMFWLNTRMFPAGSRLDLRWLNGSGGGVGNKVDIATYITDYTIDVWQLVTIPIEDFSLTGDVQKLEIIYAKEAGQQFWFDEFELYPSGGGGGPYTFRFEAPNANMLYHLSMLVLLVSDNETGWDHDTFANISKLSSGLVLRHVVRSTGDVLWSFNSRDNMDLFGRYHPQESFTFSNGQLLLGFMVKPGKASIKVTNDNVLEFIVRDDLSGIDNIRAFAHFGIEEVQ